MITHEDLDSCCVVQPTATAHAARATPAFLLAAALLVVASSFSAHASEEKEDPREALRARANALLGVLPEEAPNPDNPITPEKIELGRILYYDARLSISNEISCNTCHDLANFGVDNEPTSPGHEGQRGNRNSPTVYNAALHVAQFWDGRAADVEEQAKGPVLNPVEMGMPDEAYVLRVLAGIPGYRPLFEKAFPDAEDPIDYDRVAKAIGAFERRLMTPSRFDDFLAGDLDALSSEERAGLARFLDLGCASCHNGAPVGGLMFQKVGLVHPYETDDLGRYEVTGKEEDKRVFKVPSLRNVAKTHPYFHDGSIATLEEAVRLMGWHQLGRELDEADIEAVIVFLESLTGRIDEEFIARPAMPQ